MSVWLLLLLEPWTVITGQSVLKRLHSYDVEAMVVEATPKHGGLQVQARVRLRPRRPGPVRFLISSHVQGLTATVGGKAIHAAVGAGGIEKLAARLAGPGADIPTLLTLRPRQGWWKVGAPVTIELTYRWKPPGTGWSYAGANAVQTHLSGFWLPAMAGELFDLDLLVRTALPTTAPGVRTREDAGWRFRTKTPVAIAPLIVGEFAVAKRVVADRTLEIWTPPTVRLADEATAGMLDDLEAVLATLAKWFGPLSHKTFRIIIDPRARPMPAYCGDTFAVVRSMHLERARGRTRWLELLAHECSHAYWGYRLKTPVIGDGGTWIREGLAQWCGIEVAGVLTEGGMQKHLWRRMVKLYLGQADIRRSKDGTIFVNEPSLRDASYLDDPLVPYVRGALVWRRFDHTLGRAQFLAMLRQWASRDTRREWTVETLLGDGALTNIAHYYANETRLPDFVINYDGQRTLKVTIEDARWPRDTIDIALTRGARTWTKRVAVGESITLDAPVDRIEIDPERVHLDPVRLNSVWVR